MKFVFISNYLTLHQKPFCDCMFEHLRGDFYFISTVPMEQERLDMGWRQVRPDYILDVGVQNNLREHAQRLIEKSDVVLVGDVPDDWLQLIIESGAKLILQNSERIFKRGIFQAFGMGAWRHRVRYQRFLKKRKAYMLCASAYLPFDLFLLGAYRNRCYQWGYFPEVRKYDDIEKVIALKTHASILWVGRFIKWKHPEDAIYLAIQLREKGIHFELTLIGNGEEKDKMEQLIRANHLKEIVHLYGFMEPEKVRTWMEKSDIFIFTSDRNEGWGAVLNEAMNAGCAVVANRAAGSAPYLVQDGVNGILYDRRKKDDCCRKVELLLRDVAYRKEIQRKAYKTMDSMWNSDIASARILNLSQKLLKGEETEYTSGPCSKAKVIIDS